MLFLVAESRCTDNTGMEELLELIDVTQQHGLSTLTMSPRPCADGTLMFVTMISPPNVQKLVMMLTKRYLPASAGIVRRE